MAKKLIIKNKWLLWLDTVMVFLNLSTSYSLIPYLVFRQYDRYTNMILLFVLDIVYLFIRFGRRKKEAADKQDARTEDKPRPKGVVRMKTGTLLIILYAAISLMCIFAGIVTGTGWKSALVYLALNVVFFIMLKMMFARYKKTHSVKESVYLLSRGYLILALLSVISCVLMFGLIKAGVNPYVNDVSNKYDLFFDNVVNFEETYYFPYHLCVLGETSDIRLPFFQEAGLLTGLYHEPHCLTFMVFPALFLLLFLAKAKWQKWLLAAMYLLIILLTASTTNIAAVFATLVVYLFYTFKSSLAKSGILVLLLILIVIAVRSFVDLTALDFIFNKLESGSLDYSMSTIDFALQPRSLLGTNFYNLGFLKSAAAARTMDVGYITFFLNIGFLGVVLWRMFLLFKSRSELKLAVLLFAVYFFAHSAKVAMVAYSLTMLVFVFYLVAELSHTPDAATE